MIGIVGGIGPLAGVDLYKRIVANTPVQQDQDHLPVLLASLPGEISDRTSYLLGKSTLNPAEGLAKVARLLENAGAEHIAIACNTAHAPAIYNPMMELLQQQGFAAKMIHLIDVTVAEILAHADGLQRIGLLSTSGTYQTRIYQDALASAGLTPVLLPFEQHAALVHEAIYQIKVSGENIAADVLQQLDTATGLLERLGAQAVILGCTEIGMIAEQLSFGSLTVFNPNAIMAQKLIGLYR
jgi:aspartate racemase